MGYFAGNLPPHLEQWELEEKHYLSSVVSALPYRRRMAILLSVGLVAAIEFSNRLSVNVLLPDMQGNVGANSDEISWVVILYNVGFLCSLALATWTMRVLGTRRHLLISIALYSVGAMGCVLSLRSLRLLLVSRLIMGFGGGAFLMRAIILSKLMFPGKERVTAVTWLYAVLYAFLIPYPVTMGWITDTFRWNYAFLLDLPFMAIGAFLIWGLIPPGHLYPRNKAAHVDAWGPILLIASLVCLQTAASRGERDLWFESSWIAPALIAAAILFIAFLWRESRPENTSPVFHLRMVWRQGSLRASFGVVLIVGALLGAGIYVAPQYLRFVQDYSTTQTGGFISAYTTGLGTGLVISLHVLVSRLGVVRTMIIGLVSLTATYFMIVFLLTPTTPTAVLVPAIFLQGFCLAPVIIATSNIATANAQLPDINDISATYFFVRQLGNTFGVTAATITFDHRMTLHSSRLLDVANRLDPTVHSTLSQYALVIHRNGGAGSNPTLGALQLFQNGVVTQSRLLSYIDIYLGLAAITGLALILISITYLKRPPQQSLWVNSGSGSRPRQSLF
jgi:DHA2 family multidrug resistance protein